MQIMQADYAVSREPGTDHPAGAPAISAAAPYIAAQHFPSSATMSTTLAAPPGGAIPSNGNGDARSHGSFWALTIGSVGVVYGDIGTSPLYAFREAVTA